MATYVIYSGTSDGRIFSSNATYLTARSGSGLTAADTGVNDMDVGQVSLGGTYYCYEGFLQFDTSSVSGTALTATLSIYGNLDNSGVDFTLNARAHDWGTAIDTGDWVAGASLSGKALRASRSTAGLSTSAYNDFTEDSSFISNLTSPVRLILSSSRHEGGNTPTASAGGDANDERVFFQTSDTTGTSQDPKLTVVTVAPITGTDTGTGTDTATIVVSPTAVGTVVVYADAADGYLYSTHATTYATARSGGGTFTGPDTTGALAAVGQLNYSAGLGYYCYEAALSFDTSAVSGTPLSVTLAVYGYIDDSGTDFTINARAYDWGSSYTTADWVAGASLTGNALRASLETSRFVTAAYNSFTSDSSFVSNATNPVRLLLASSRLEAGTSPTASTLADANDERVFFQTADTTGTTQDPKLTFVLSPADSGTGTDTASVNTGSTTKTASETPSGTDATSTLVVAPKSPAGGPLGAPSSLVDPYEFGSGTETAAIVVGIGSTTKSGFDTGTGSDASALGVLLSKSAFDAGTGTDSSGAPVVPATTYTRPFTAPLDISSVTAPLDLAAVTAPLDLETTVR